MKRFGSYLLSIFFIFNLAACGGGNTYTNNLSPEEQAVAVREFLSSPSFLSSGFITAPNLPSLQAQTVTQDCPQGGNLSVTEDGQAEYNNCDFGNGFVIDGGLSMQSDGNNVTIHYDNLSITDGALGTSFYDGTVAFHFQTQTTEYQDFAFGREDEIFVIDGTIIDNGDGTLDGHVTFKAAGDTVADCDFDAFSGSEDDINNSCNFS